MLLSSMNFAQNIIVKTDYDNASVSVEVYFYDATEGCLFHADVSFEGETMFSGTAPCGQPLTIAMPEDFLRWTPDHPFLYDLKVKILHNGAVINEIETQFAMRCFNAEPDENGIAHFTINHLPVFLFGPSFYPEPCSEDSVCSELQKIRDLGYNMVRLHGDLVPQSWYRYCDRIGLVVWHDASDEVSLPLKSVPIVEISVPLDKADVEKATVIYLEYANRIYLMAFQGFAAAVFERFSDSETDRCGLMTHDGKTPKFDEKRIMQINRKISHALAQ